VAHVRGAGTLDKSTGSKDVFFAWCASYSMVPKGGDEGVLYGGPAAPGLISTTTDGSSDALVSRP
jgi:hypothetical protein